MFFRAIGTMIEKGIYKHPRLRCCFLEFCYYDSTEDVEGKLVYQTYRTEFGTHNLTIHNFRDEGV
jgi:hypothetical protein